MIADYFVWRRRKLDVEDLYRTGGRYHYSGGFSVVGFATLAMAVLPNIPGFLVTIKVLPVEAFPAWIVSGYHYAWFIGFALAFGIYLILRPLFPNR
jgi:NCS1 family nucleobase:cation symporter-1